MSYQNRLRTMLYRAEVDRTLATSVAVISIALLGLWVVAPDPLVLVIPLATGSGSITYLATRERHGRAVGLPTLPRPLSGYLPAAVMLTMAAFVLTVWMAGQRTLLSYLLAGGAGTLVLAQIMLIGEDRLKPGLLLFQILLVAIVLRFAGLLATPGYIGVDIWTHLGSFVPGIVDTGSLAAIDQSKYVMAPLYHSFAAISTLVFGSPRTGVYLTLGLLIPLAVLFVYGAGRLLLPARWALVAVALFAFADEFVLWGLHIIPTSLGLVFFLVVLYGVTRLLGVGVEGWMIAVIGVFSLAIVFTHQVSTVVLLIFLGIAATVALATDVAEGWPGSGQLSRKSLALGAVFGLTTVVTLVSWANTPYSDGDIFLWRMLDIAAALIVEQAGFLNLIGTDGAAAAGGSPTLLARLIPFITLIGFGLLLSLAVIGGFRMIGWDRPVDVTAVYLVGAGVLFAGAFGLSLFGIRVFLPDRWLAFLYALMAIIAAAGLYHISGTSSRRVFLAVAVVLAVGYPTTMAVAKRATYDSPAFPDQFDRFAYTNPEIDAARSIGEFYPPGVAEGIHTDHPYQTIFEPIGGYEASDTLPLGADGAVSSRAIVYRTYQSTGPVKFTVTGPAAGTLVRQSAAATTVCPTSRNVVYGNDQVWLCLPPETGPGGGP